MGELAIVGATNVAVGDGFVPPIGMSHGNVEEFPPLHSPVKKGKSKGRGRGNINSKNKFDVLSGVDSETIDDLRKPRAASLGVASLLQEMKARKIGKVKANVHGATGQGGVSFSQ
ncbi:hypothetical protein V6N13_099165 [Hibiscus sabdariffa]|uniref:Uncharacterized protein n=1 Tax=Hibiscus sabdariffa TaxID=183260 RepID=A0ABR2PYU2_9ROSI